MRLSLGAAQRMESRGDIAVYASMGSRYLVLCVLSLGAGFAQRCGKELEKGVAQ